MVRYSDYFSKSRKKVFKYLTRKKTRIRLEWQYVVLYFIIYRMKKFIYFLSLIFGLSLLSWQTFASDSLQHLKLDDGRHFCSPFMTNQFKLCSDFGIEYSWDNVISWDAPFFSFDKLAIIEWIPRCVKQGKEAPLNDCDETYINITADWNFECIVKSGVEKCTKQDSSNWDSVNEWDDNQMNSSDTIASQSTCIVNGKEVDCAEMADNIATWFRSIVKYGVIFGLIWLLATIFYIWMLVHAISKPIPNKIVWILVIFFLSPIWAIVYYFAIKRNFNEWVTNTTTPPQTVPYAMNLGVTYNEWPITNSPAQTEWTLQTPASQTNSIETNNTPSPTV